MAGFRKAKGEQAMLKMGVYGPAGSGKTLSSLLFAEGLAALSGKRIAFVDTERGTDFYCQAVPSRKIHPQAFDFDALYSRSITEVLSSVRSLSSSEYGVIVIDSITHLWEAARNAYSGRTGAGGQIPMHAWGKIKKPYKDLMNHLLSCDMHVIICGRQGMDFEEDEETGETKCIGTKMKAEGETAYEPHILIRMEAVKQKRGEAIIQAFGEKDRTSTIHGKTIQNPTFDNVCRPILPLLSGTQAKIASDDETSAADAETLATQEKEKARKSDAMYQDFDARNRLCKTSAELKELGKQLTPAVKKEMLASHVTGLREKYQDRERVLAGETVPETSDAA